MKEEKADSSDSLVFEEVKSISSPDASLAHNVEPQAEEKHSQKRNHTLDDYDQRPSKIPRIESPSASETNTSNEHHEKSTIATACRGTSSHSFDAVAGCSKDTQYFGELSSSLWGSCTSSILNETLTVDGQHCKQEVDEESTQPVELMNLSDDVLLIIMSNLKPTDLLNLSSCCQRLCRVASDWSLWIDVDFRPHRLLEGQLEKFVPFFSDTTERIATRGFVASKPSPRWRTECLSTELLTSFSTECPELRSFTAEEHCIDANKIKISAFPRTIEHLSLKGSEIINPPADSSYFNKIFRYLPHIKVLELSDCTWLPPHSFMALSKLPHLEELHLDGCYLIKDCIAYASLAFNMGFSSLKVLDLRRTGVSDSELSCVNRSNRLTHLYLEYPSSYGVMNENGPGPRACHLPGIISDLGLRSLVISDKPHVVFNNAQFGIASEEIHVMAPMKDRVSLCKLHTLVARNFNLVTDATLNELHFAQSLRHLDLKGTQITQQGAETFRSSRPDVTLITSYDDEFT